MGPERPHTAYSAAKFAVKGFTEALITDLRVNAPHVKCVGRDAGPHRHVDRAELVRHGVATSSTARCKQLIDAVNEMFRDNAPMSAAEAATVILQGVRDERWRILVGDDAVALDKAVRADPEHAYEGMLLGDEFGRRHRSRSPPSLSASTRLSATSRPACRTRALVGSSREG